MERNTVEVVIGGVVYTLVSDESEEHIQKIASLINKKITDISNLNPVPTTINNNLRSLHVMINIADDYVKLNDRYEEETSEHHDQFEQAISKIEELVLENSTYENENRTLKQRVKTLTDELERTRKELDEYIETFDN